MAFSKSLGGLSPLKKGMPPVSWDPSSSSHDTIKSNYTPSPQITQMDMLEDGYLSDISLTDISLTDISLSCAIVVSIVLRLRLNGLARKPPQTLTSNITIWSIS
jgi:hypothetical protein